MSSSELAEVLRDPCSRGPGARSSDWVGDRGSASGGGCLSTVVVVSLTVSAVGQSQSCIVVCRCAGRALDCGRCRERGRRFCFLGEVPRVGLPLSVGGLSWRGECLGCSGGGEFLLFLSCGCRWLGELVGSGRVCVRPSPYAVHHCLKVCSPSRCALAMEGCEAPPHLSRSRARARSCRASCKVQSFVRPTIAPTTLHAAKNAQSSPSVWRGSLDLRSLLNCGGSCAL